MREHENHFYVGVIGERHCDDVICKIAEDVGRLIAEEGWVLVCGGMGGVMEHACRGAASNGGTTIGILPGETREEANPYLTFSIVTGLGEARNSIVVKSCNAVISISGNYGTLSEIAFANLFHIPVIGIKTWEILENAGAERKLLDYKASTAEDAINYIKKITKDRDGNTIS